MKYITLPNGKQMSKVGLGVSRFGTRTPAELADAMLDRFCQAGGTLVDTARNYYEWVEQGRGKSESFLGEWIERRGCREQIVLSTKGGVRNQGKKFLIDLSRANLLDELDESLDALRTDYLDIYLLHRDEPERPVEEIVESLQEIGRKGNCNCLGVCNWRLERIQAANRYAEAHGLEPVRVIQTWWSLASYTREMWDDPTTTHMDEETYDYCKEHGCLVMGYTSQAKGFFQKACEVGIDNLSPMLKYRILTEANRKKYLMLQQYCAETGARPTGVVLGYITSNLLPGTALVSCSSLEQLNDVLENSDSTLPQDVLQKFDEIEKSN